MDLRGSQSDPGPDRSASRSLPTSYGPQRPVLLVVDQQLGTHG
jgi:hypothetical protein